MTRIYVDNAATSFPKPESVYRAVDDYQRRLGAPVGRGAYSEAMEVARIVSRCRHLAAQLLGAESPERIVFTFNGTDSLSLALHGTLHTGDHVITSAVEHNSVLRPLREIESRLGIELSVVSADATGRVDPEAIRQALRPATRLIALTHASNVTGTVQPVEAVGQIAAEAGALFLVDAAQTAGQLPIDLRTLRADFLACSGHKGLLGPLGTGLLYVRPGRETMLRSLRQGGTGTVSELELQPETMPDKYESGNHNALGLVGLEAALHYFHERGVAQIHAHEAALTERLLLRLQELPGVQTYGPAAGEGPMGLIRTAVVSLNVEGFEPLELAAVLEEFDIQTRAGLHCAPGVHRLLGTTALGGTLRVSFGPFNTEADADAVADALAAITG